MSVKTIKDICELFWLLEKKYNLLEFEIDGVKPWQFRRMQLYYMISEKTEVLEQAHTKLTKKDKIFSLFGLVKNSILFNPFFHNKTDILIFPHERSKKVNNIYIDIYTDYLEKKFIDNNLNFCTMERPFLGRHIREPNKNKKYLDFIVLIANIGKKFVKVKINDKDKLLISNLNKDIKEYFNIDFDIEVFFIEAIQRYKINYYLYTKLFQRLSPKELYVVVSYAHGDLIKAAKDLNIITKEIQHGTFSQYHLGYSFPEQKIELDYFPDQLLVWNKYWKDMIKLPIANKNILLYPFQYLESQKNNYQKYKRNDNQMVVLSQGAIGEKMANVILENITLFKDYQIKYKLHPGEYDRWKSYPSLVKLSNLENVEIIKDIDLYELFSKSSIQIGVFSTAIYEGVEFGCKTILIDLPGIEYMDKFIEFYSLKKEKDFYVGC